MARQRQVSTNPIRGRGTSGSGFSSGGFGGPHAAAIASPVKRAARGIELMFITNSPLLARKRHE
jgi:hypothetical protein